MDTPRCAWVGNERIYIDYHDHEWGVPVHDDNTLFEYLILDGFQAGLSWLTILKKREHFRVALDNFNPSIIANYTEEKIQELLDNKDIIRNQQKIRAAVNNANAFLKVQKEYGTFDAYIWQFTGGKTIVNKWDKMDQVPAKTAISDSMAKDLKKRGFKYVGSTICYAFMQAAGMVNDHLTYCFKSKTTYASE